jgi:hypothetical protein
MQQGAGGDGAEAKAAAAKKGATVLLGMVIDERVHISSR